MATVTGIDLYKKYGHPLKVQVDFEVWDVPSDLEVGILPDKVYCHPNLVPHLTQAFQNLIDRKLDKELKSWDGCVNFRPIRGREEKYYTLIKQGKEEEAMKYLSIHSWGMAIDVNAATNGLGKKPTLSPEFVKCFTDAGFEWGGKWKRLDGMHFQLATV